MNECAYGVPNNFSIKNGWKPSEKHDEDLLLKKKTSNGCFWSLEDGCYLNQKYAKIFPIKTHQSIWKSTAFKDR